MDDSPNRQARPGKTRRARRLSAAALLATACLASSALGSDLALSLQTRDGRARARVLQLEDRRAFGVELIRLLTDPDRAVRARAARAAGRIGKSEAIEPLAALLHDDDAQVRAAAAFALGEIEDSTAAVPLAILLRSSREEEAHVRALAIEGLGKLQSVQHAPLCVAALHDPAREVQEAACLASWLMHAAGAAERLLELTNDPAGDLRWKATYALMRMLGAPVSGRTSIPGGTDLDQATRGRIHDALLQRAGDRDARVRMSALRGLGNFTGEETIAALNVSLADPDWRVRVEAIRGLTAMASRAEGDGTAQDLETPSLATLLEDGNPNVRLSALEALGTIGGERQEAERLLRAHLDDANPRVQQVAALALARRFAAAGAEAAGAILELAERLAQSQYWPVRASAAQVLEIASLPDSSLYRRLLHDDPRVAKEVIAPVLTARARQRAAGTPILDALRADLAWLLEAPDPILRALTLEAAGEIVADSLAPGETERWIEILQQAWQRAGEDPDLEVRRTILALLETHVATEPEPAQAILAEAARSNDPQLRHEAERIAREKDLPLTATEPIAPGRTLAEYAAILRWADADREVEIVTARGPIRIALFPREAPLTCWSFTRLAASGFYDGGTWHRIVPDFVVQGGCPRGDGWGGPGYQIRCEINQHRYGAGAVGMALSGKDTGGSQFFITHSPQPHLDGRYTVFGQVVEGMEIVDALIQGDRIESIRLIGDN